MHVHSTRRLLALCILVGGLWAACSHNNGPATNAYLKQSESIVSGLADQLRQFQRIAPPSRPVLPPNPTDDQQRVYDGMVRIYPLYINQYYAAAIKRYQAVSDAYNQALEQIGALDASGADPLGVQYVNLRVQLLTEQRDFFTGLHSLADHSQTALVRRESADPADDLVVRVLSKATGTGADGEVIAEPVAAVAGLKDAAAAVAKRPPEPFGIGDEIAKLIDQAGQLQRDGANFQTEGAKLAASIRAKFPVQDWGMLQQK